MPVSPRLRSALLIGTCAMALAVPIKALAASNAASQPVADDGPGVVQGQPQERETEFGTDSGGGPGTGDSALDGNAIVVQGTRLRGQLDVEQAPLLELGEEDIAAEGVASIADLVQQIQNQTGSARGRGGGGGRPVILVNGIRTGSFRELFQYPPESLARVEVFPEEVAQRFGFPPDRRVINLILKEDYSSAEVEFEFEGPARGGQFVNEQEFGYLKIADGGRINFNFTAQDASILTEAERGVIQTPGSISQVAGDPGQAEFRSLVPDSRTLDANLSWAKAFLDSGISLSANANYERRDSRSLDGLNLVVLSDDPVAPTASLTRTFGANDPLERRTATDTGAVAGSLSAPVNAFRLTSTLDASVSESTTQIDNRFNAQPFIEAAQAGTLALDGPLPADAEAGFETAFSRRWNAVNLNTLDGTLADLPGGELRATFDLGYTWDRIESADTRSNTDVQLTRGAIQTGANLVIPITSRRNGFADALGSFTFNAQAGLEELSDFGTLGDYNLSLNWAPFDNLDISATYIYREVAPSLENLGNPQITNFNVPVFDFTTGETVLADVTTGGNPALPAETQRDWKFAVNWELPFIDGARFTVEYIRNRSDNVTSAFPQITPEIEAAFPGRVTRALPENPGEIGRLIAVDRRAVNFAETRADRIEFRLSTRGSFGGGERGGFGGPARGAGGGGQPAGAPTSRTTATGAAEEAGTDSKPAPAAPQRGSGFMAFRERICADDGLDVLRRLVAAARAGEDVSAILPRLPPQLLDRLIGRFEGVEGEITDEQLSGVRSRICSVGAGGTAQGQASEAGDALRARLCGADGLAEMRRIVAMIERGEDVSDLLPGMDPAFLKLGLDRFRAEDGSIPDEVLERFRSRICSAGGEGGPPASGPPGAGGRPGEGAGGGGPPAFNPLAGGDRGWRYFANLTHTIELANEILIAPGVPLLDQLDGDATGAFCLPRHSTRLEAGLFGKGLGMRLSGRYTGSTRLNGSGLPGSSDLLFDDLATLDLRVFTNVDELTGSKSPLLKNVRISLRMDNIFDGRIAVRDETGGTPINYQPFVIDPIGRFIGVDIRKLF